MKRSLAATVLTLALPGAAHAGSDLEVADAVWAGHACTGQVQVVWDEAVGERGVAGEATIGGPCLIALDPVRWRRMSPEQRCLLVVHEVGHVAGHEHGGGVMTAGERPPGAVAGCERDGRVSRRERVARAVRARLGPSWEPVCGVWRRGVARCQVWSADGSRMQRWRARVGETVELERLRANRAA